MDSIIDIMENSFRINKVGYLPKLQLPAFTLGQNFAVPATILTTAGISFDLPRLFIGNTTPASYALCDDNGQELVKENDNKKRKVQLASGETVILKGVTIDASNQLIGQNVSIEPIENVKFPVTIELQVRGRIQEPNTGIQLDNYKPLTLTINAPTLTNTDREQAYDTVNAAL